MGETTIASFLLRFVQESPPDATPPPGTWRGLIRHVQSGDECPFTRIEDALAFIGRYVELERADREGRED